MKSNSVKISREKCPADPDAWCFQVRVSFLLGSRRRGAALINRDERAMNTDRAGENLPHYLYDFFLVFTTLDSIFNAFEKYSFENKEK